MSEQRTSKTNPHTPGPWRVTPFSSIVGIGVMAARGVVVASVLGDKPTGTANGHLIAAAPDLLALAKRYASECSNCDGTGTYSEFYDDDWVKAVEDCEDCADIRAVIAKAESKA